MATNKTLQVLSEETDNQLSVFINIHNRLTLSVNNNTDEHLQSVFCFDEEEDILIFISELIELKNELYG